MLVVASRPKLEGLALQLPDQPRGLGSFPLAGIPVLLGSADPPALPGESIRLADDPHPELWPPPLLRLVVDKGEHLAQRPHLGPREMMAEKLQHFRVAD